MMLSLTRSLLALTNQSFCENLYQKQFPDLSLISPGLEAKLVESQGGGSGLLKSLARKNLLKAVQRTSV
jgi:hypothetical protein